MAHLHSLDELAPQNVWLTVGVFDGVHRGHQDVLRRLVSGAHAEGCAALLLTFDPHPAVALGGRTDFKCLTNLDERCALAKDLGVDQVITQPFDRIFAGQTAEEFMQRLVRRLRGSGSRPAGLRRLILGYDSALGRGREGDAARLAEIGRELGFSVEVVPALRDESGIISSTRIRSVVAAGNVTEAAALLGRPYTVSGPVIHGDGRGKRLNLPTANIAYPPEKLLPANGIYATWTWAGGQRYPSATNIGINPTFTPDKRSASLEVHLLDFQRDLYGQELRVEFVERLRDEQRFDSVEELLRQIWDDIAQTRKILGI